jgi:hypothetical protein
MTCDKVQNRILALPDPRQVPDGLRGHLDDCPACTAWWKQSLQIERQLTELPVPPAPAGKKSTLIADLHSAPAPVAAAATRSRDFLRSPVVKYAAALAASILVVLGGWLVFRPSKQPEVVVEPAKHPLLETVSGRIVALSESRSQSERMEVLGSLAGDLSLESRNLARIAGEDELRDLSGWFRHVVDDGLVKQARAMNPHSMSQTEKKALLEKLTAVLAEAERESERRAEESPPHAQVELRKIASTARDGQARLRAIFTGEGA